MTPGQVRCALEYIDIGEPEWVAVTGEDIESLEKGCGNVDARGLNTVLVSMEVDDSTAFPPGAGLLILEKISREK